MEYQVYCNGTFCKSGSFTPDCEEQENQLIKIYPQFTDQVWENFGGAVTDSAGYVFSLMSKKMQEAFIEAYFGANGLGYKLIRVPIDSCDFSLEQYEASPDGDPAHFDMSRPLRYILPLLEAIREREPEVTLMLSPWSPPVKFKSTYRREQGGHCMEQYYTAWAEYICQYIREFTNRGFKVSRISLQNEPHAVQTWDSCIWSAREEREFLVNAMKPALLQNGFEDIEIYIWDHNKERILDRAISVFNLEGRKAADGIAFHWYSGDHFDALRKVHELFPEKKMMLSENCLEYYRFSVSDPVYVRSLIAHEIIGDLENGASAFLDWNLLLDEKGGPNYAGNYSHAPFLYDTKKKELRKQSIYDALWHFSHFLSSGSQRILSSGFAADIEKTAFLREDGKVILVLHNRGGDMEIFVWLDGQLAQVALPKKSLTTIVIESSVKV